MFFVNSYNPIQLTGLCVQISSFFPPDAMNLCLSLITQGQEDVAFSLLKTFPTLQSDNSDSSNLGNFFLRHCVNMDTVRKKKTKPYLCFVHEKKSVRPSKFTNSLCKHWAFLMIIGCNFWRECFRHWRRLFAIAKSFRSCTFTLHQSPSRCPALLKPRNWVRHVFRLKLFFA